MNVSIWGGSFNAASDGWLLDTIGTVPWATTNQILSIWGGQFGHIDAGTGIRLNGPSGLDFYGYDLSITNGLLTGHLSDGNWINLSIVTSEDWSGVINLYDVRKSVPEPASIALFVTALIGAAGFRRRKSHLQLSRARSQQSSR